jgi:hypothetical protein
MSALRYRTTNIVYGSLVAGTTILSFILDDYKGGLPALMLSVVAVCAVVAWVIQLVIERRTYKQPVRQLTPAELQRYKTTRAVIIVVFVAAVLFAVTHSSAL